MEPGECRVRLSRSDAKFSMSVEFHPSIFDKDSLYLGGSDKVEIIFRTRNNSFSFSVNSKVSMLEMPEYTEIVLQEHGCYIYST